MVYSATHKNALEAKIDSQLFQLKQAFREAFKIMSQKLFLISHLSHFRSELRQIDLYLRRGILVHHMTLGERDNEKPHKEDKKSEENRKQLSKSYPNSTELNATLSNQGLGERMKAGNYVNLQSVKFYYQNINKNIYIFLFQIPDYYSWTRIIIEINLCMKNKYLKMEHSFESFKETNNIISNMIMTKVFLTLFTNMTHLTSSHTIIRVASITCQYTQCWHRGHTLDKTNIIFRTNLFD